MRIKNGNGVTIGILCDCCNNESKYYYGIHIFRDEEDLDYYYEACSVDCAAKLLPKVLNGDLSLTDEIHIERYRNIYFKEEEVKGD